MIEEIDLGLFLEILIGEGCPEHGKYEYDGCINYRAVSRCCKYHTIINGDEEFIDKEIAEHHLEQLKMNDLLGKIPFKTLTLAEPPVFPEDETDELYKAAE